MESIFDAWMTSRQLYSDLFDKYSLDELNNIPKGFNNNIIWNIGHVIVAQQSLIYKSSAQSMLISEDLFHKYKPGTKPTEVVDQEEADELRQLLTTLIPLTINDFHSGKFKVFNARTTGTGFLLSSLTDAFVFNNFHEGLHLGYIISIRKFLN
ncbi:DinB family protein [Desertivirga brevis]|uniref:DinB family protein n=1 Tax=Desertivirga brevis TaxID=2810310 RepID=UPI001A9631E3|nr:DinB family protein [Pedobacter sp. SYSU D00873]